MSGTIFDNLHFICHMFHESPASRLESLESQEYCIPAGLSVPLIASLGVFSLLDLSQVLTWDTEKELIICKTSKMIE